MVFEPTGTARLDANLQGSPSTLLGYMPDEAGCPLRRDSGHFVAAHQLAYMDPSSVASIPFFGNEVRLLTYIRPLTAASI